MLGRMRIWGEMGSKQSCADTSSDGPSRATIFPRHGGSEESAMMGEGGSEVKC